MAYAYDSFGWFVRVAEGDHRTTQHPPKNPSTDNTPGEMRANWTGKRWVDHPYVFHDEAAHQAELEADKITREEEKAARDPANIIKGLRSEVYDLEIRVAKLEKGPTPP